MAEEAVGIVATIVGLIDIVDLIEADCIGTVVGA